jgi:phosphodiester glycosidase
MLAGLFAWLVCAATALGQTTRPFDGITLTKQVRQNPPLHLYWARVDLSNPRIHLRVCRGGLPAADGPPWETTLLPVSKIAQREHLDLAVNGNYFVPKDVKVILGVRDPYFEGNAARAVGWTVSDGQLFSAHPYGADWSSLVVERDGKAVIRELAGPPIGAWEVVSGIPLVWDGRNVAPVDAPAPRTAVGLDAAGVELTILVVDGRRPEYSAGLSLRQMGEEMLRLGCDSAIELDGGGSTTLVERFNEKWRLVNTPSDGHALPIPLCVERPVADAFGVVVDPGPLK